MIKADKPDPAKDAPQPANAAANAEKEKAEAAKPGRPRQQVFAEEAEEFCQDLDRFFRQAFGEIPKMSDLGEIRARQATVRDLVNRACAGAQESGEKLDALAAERDKLKDAAARSRADFLNYQARAQKDLERAEELALRGYVSELLPILDSFDLSTRDLAGGKADFNRLKEAFELIHKSLAQVLAVRGLERMSVVGKPFDPAVQEAVAKRPVDESKGEQPNMVVEELRPGYRWKGLVLRAAQVLVTEAGATPAAKNST